MRMTPAALRHTIDPTMQEIQLGVPRQYVSDASGRVLVTPSGQKAARVPVYGAAKPVSTTTASVKGKNIFLTGKGFSQGSGSTAWTSGTSVLQYGGKSGKLPACAAAQTEGCASTVTDRAADLQYVGAGSTSDTLWFGVSTFGNWAKVGEIVTPFIDFDTTGDGEPDYETYVQHATGTDVLLSITIDLNDDFAIVDVQPVNFNWGDVDTNVYDSNVITMPVTKEFIKLGAGSRPITYTVGTFSYLHADTLDSVGPVNFNAGTPAFSTASPLYEDQGNTSIGYRLTKPAKALVLHLHGADAKRAEVLDLPAAAPVAPPIR